MTINIVRGVTNTVGGEYNTYHEYGVTNTNNYSRIQTDKKHLLYQYKMTEIIIINIA